MTQPNEFVPDGGISDTGLAALAAKTQEDWEAELRGNVQGTIDPITDFFNFAGKIVESFVTVFGNTVGDVTTFVTETIIEPLLEFLKWMWDNFGAAVNTFLKPIMTWLKWLWDLFSGATGLTAPTGGAAGILSPLFAFFKWLWDLFGPMVESVFKPILTWLNWLWRLFANTPGPNPEPTGPGADILVPIFKWLDWLWELFGAAIQAVLKPIFEWLNWLWRLFANIPGDNPEPTGPGADILVPLFKWLDWLWEQFGAAVEAVLKPIFTWLNWLWRLFANVPGPNPEPTGPGADILVPLFKWLDDLWEKIGATVLAAFNNLVQSVSSLISLPTLQNLIEKIAAAFTGVLNPQAFVDLLIQIINYFTSLFKTKSITDFTNSLPIIGPLVSAITGLTEKDGVALDFGTLGTFFRDLEKKATVSRSALDDVANKILGGILSIGMLNTTEPNLLSQGEFATADTVEAGGGWSWDNTVSATSTGGSLLATATGSLQQMYSRQSIKVASGDKITVSASVLTSGFTSGSMVLSIIPWIGTTQQTTHVVATRTSSASTFQAMTGSTIIIGGTAGSGEIALPAGVTSIQVRLAVNANTGAKVWFDEIAVRKTGLVEQNWVTNLTDTWAKFWEGLVGSSGSGKTWADMFNAALSLRNFADGTNTNLGTLSGNLLTAPATVLGSLFSVVFDGTKTVGDFLRLLYNALNNSTATGPKTATDVANAAGAARDQADLGVLNAGLAAGDALVADILATMAGAANNMIVSPDMEETVVRRSSGAVGGDSSGGYGFTWGYSTNYARSGTQSMKLAATSNFFNGSYRYVNFAPVKSDETLIKYPVAPGQVYHYDVEFYVTGSGTTLSVGPGLIQFNRSGQTSGIFSELMFQTVTNPTKNTWLRLSGTYTIPQEVNSVVGEPVYAQPIFTLANAVNGDAVYIDRFVIWR